jgi:DNA-directed RNA polymerase subunit omega
MIESHQTQIEVDEPEEDAMALLHGGRGGDKPDDDDMSEENSCAPDGSAGQK